MFVAFLAAILVTFPAENQRLPVTDRTYVIGAAETNRRERLYLNGVEIDVYRTGAFLAMAKAQPGTNTLTLSKSVSVTPNVTTAGYISAGTAGNSTVSLTASVTTKAAATYNTSTSDQTISASQYLTGAQTIKAVQVSGLSADKILSGTTVTVGDSNDPDRIASVTGTVTFQTIYSGSSAPSSSSGSNGDIYIQTA